MTLGPEARLTGRGAGADAVSGRALPGVLQAAAVGHVLLSPPHFRGLVKKAALAGRCEPRLLPLTRAGWHCWEEEL